MQWWMFVVAFFVFLWPFVLPVLCVGVIFFIPRRRLIKAIVMLAALIALSVAPVAFSVWNSRAEPWRNGIMISALLLYPAIVAITLFALLLRGSVIWAKGGRPKGWRGPPPSLR